MVCSNESALGGLFLRKWVNRLQVQEKIKLILCLFVTAYKHVGKHVQ